MRVSTKILVATAAAASVVVFAAPAHAALPIGAGNWGPSDNISGTAGCLADGAGDCQIVASSTSNAGSETCTSGTAVIGPPSVTVEFGCHVVFTAKLTLTGAGGELGLNPVDIETGACAGLTISDATLDITDGGTGHTRVYPRVVVAPSGWKFEGNYVSANVGALSAYVIHAAGSISPACTRIIFSNGDQSIQFYGSFQGNYHTL